ncbi:hypothetical protein Salat_0865400 [Sesamum alatum]|uniref:Uncharacterized protein n=1 Tax=Sesamum alatum TaxID=300844 RepID=A0AAE1YJ51_9LAMI|nr:hypothetical protein Salat_0865400 [Sesamum alatum]
MVDSRWRRSTAADGGQRWQTTFKGGDAAAAEHGDGVNAAAVRCGSGRRAVEDCSGASTAWTRLGQWSARREGEGRWMVVRWSSGGGSQRWSMVWSSSPFVFVS